MAYNREGELTFRKEGHFFTDRQMSEKTHSQGLGSMSKLSKAGAGKLSGKGWMVSI